MVGMDRADKLSISMPPELVATVRAAAAAEGLSLSAWLTRAAADAADREQRLATGLAEARALVADVGPAADADRARVRTFLADIEADEQARTRHAS